MQQHLITPNDVKKNTREVAKLVSENKILIYIEESENLDIKPALGEFLIP